MPEVPFILGEVGHFGLAVRDPKKSAKWFEHALGLKKEFDFNNGVAVGNDYVTIAFSKESRRRKPSITCRFICRISRRWEKRSII